jgi:hypothetical protein
MLKPIKGLREDRMAVLNAEWKTLVWMTESGFCPDMVNSQTRKLRKTMARYGVTEIVPDNDLTR